MLSISTCWNSARHTDGAAMIEELLQFGFDRVELGHGIRISLMGGIQEQFDKGRVQFSSLHNFCPLPLGINEASPDCFQFSSHREEERERAVRQTLQTIDYAARLNVPYVILHCGHIPIPPITEQLTELALHGQHLSAEYAKKKTKTVQKREKLAPKYLARVKDCLRKIVEHAASKNVRLGLESRMEYENIPSERDFDELLAEFPASTVGYWHDFGHVQVRHNLGFVDHAEWLARISPRLLGCHLHDVEWPAHDHRPPFTGGTVNYAQLLPLLPPERLLVWEMSPRCKSEAIAESLRLWKERFGP